MEMESHAHSTAGELRAHHKALRTQMTPDEVREKSLAICRRLTESKWYAACELLYGYYPLGNEVDCRTFLAQALADGKRVALPRMEAQRKDDCQMDFYEIRSLLEVAEGGFHVMEPLETCPLIQKENAVVLVPGVVFDGAGNRYGYGRGYYDRYFARYSGLYKVALAYENQMEQQILVSDTDVAMDSVCTEKRVYKNLHT